MSGRWKVEKIMQKIGEKQVKIVADMDLTPWGYTKCGLAPSGIQRWKNLDNNLTQKHRNAVRNRDRKFMEARLGTVYLDDKVLHHIWDSWDKRVVLLSKEEHSNGGIEKQSRKWLDEEEWYE